MRSPPRVLQHWTEHWAEFGQRLFIRGLDPLHTTFLTLQQDEKIAKHLPWWHFRGGGGGGGGQDDENSQLQPELQQTSL